MSEKVCIVAGVGPGNGAAFTRRFAEAGYRVAMLARDASRLAALEREIPGARGYATDVGDEKQVAHACERIRADLGAPGVLIHNAGSGAFKTFCETQPDDLEASLRTNTLSLLLLGREVVPDMLQAGGGSIVVIGATASLRGGAHFAAFAAGKAGQRALAQSMARSLGPRGIHVSYVVVDGVIDMPRTRAFFRDRPDDFFLRPDAIAETVYHLTRQDRSAWTFEADLRPFGESW